MNCTCCHAEMTQLAPERCRLDGLDLHWCPSCGSVRRDDLNNLTATGVQWLAPLTRPPRHQALVTTTLVAEGVRSTTFASLDGRPLARAQSHMDLDSPERRWARNVMVLDRRELMPPKDAVDLAEALITAASSEDAP